MPDSKLPPPLPQVRLQAPLPPDVVPSLIWGPLSYRKYPVFSLTWLKRRSAFAAVLIAGYGTLSLVANRAVGFSWYAVLVSSALFMTGGFVMVTGGPALGAWVLHRRMSSRGEARSIVAVAVVGFVIAVFADYWTSEGILHALHPGHQNPATIRMGSSQVDYQLARAMSALFAIGSIFFHAAISGSVAALSYFSERRRLRVRAMHQAVLDTDMKLAVLQAQIEPHFLFNTLASIRPLIRQDAARAEVALDALSDHLRATIPQMRPGGGRVMSTLGQQLDICASYLGVMKMRMGARLHHELEVPEALRAQEFPPLILLSLVENAIKHGIEPKPGPGHILIRASVSGTDLQVSVLDDGQGLKDGLSSGLGLSNIREQLQVRYGGKARLMVAARPEGGTVAGIMIPQNP